MCVRGILFCLSALGLVALGVAEAGAQPKSVKLTNEWRGSVEDADMAKGRPDCITTAKAFEELWKAWKIADKMPAIDFTKEMVILVTSPGSKINLSARLDDKGNLEVLGMGTLDFRPGFRYVIGTVTREGVKTVNKKELPKN